MSAFTVKELAERWKTDRSTVVRLIGAGKLKAFRLFREYRIRAEEVERYESGGGEDE